MSPYLEIFIMHIGEMGSRWGLNRTLGRKIQGQLDRRRQVRNPGKSPDS